MARYRESRRLQENLVSGFTKLSKCDRFPVGGGGRRLDKTGNLILKRGLGWWRTTGIWRPLASISSRTGRSTTSERSKTRSVDNANRVESVVRSRKRGKIISRGYARVSTDPLSHHCH